MASPTSAEPSALTLTESHSIYSLTRGGAPARGGLLHGPMLPADVWPQPHHHERQRTNN
jgi:hypothetical protein